jgi:16S rRNA (uracil1498-N3)-methyltransferase
MRVHRFFTNESVSQTETRITEPSLIHQMRDVFRLKKGDTVILFDNSGYQYDVEIKLLTREEGTFKTKKKIFGTFIPKKNIHLGSALIKKTFEWVLEKGTELGVSQFTPVISERSEKKNFNFERGQRIVIESAEQSGKTVIPTLHSEIDLKNMLEGGTEDYIVLHVTGEKFQVQHFDAKKDITILIGPEGGWSEKEVTLFKEKNIPIFSLGEQVLRAETAAIAVASLLLL